MFVRLAMLTALFLCASPAWADALDGDWCNPQEGKLTIEGDTIITPGGKSVTGEYGRHRFVYTAPSDDWNGGKRIVIQQFSDSLMELTIGDGQPHKWKPCVVVS